VPIFGVFVHQFAFSHRDDVCLKVQFVPVIPEKFKEQLSNRFVVLPAELSQDIKIVIKRAEQPIGRDSLIVGASLQTGENWRLSRLQEVDDQTDPCI
jgi:hypothetical protein